MNRFRIFEDFETRLYLLTKLPIYLQTLEVFGYNQTR